MTLPTPSDRATGATIYQRMVQSVRPSATNQGKALVLQRRGLTLSEIADLLNVQLLAVQNTLYWDLMQ